MLDKPLVLIVCTIAHIHQSQDNPPPPPTTATDSTLFPNILNAYKTKANNAVQLMLRHTKNVFVS